MVKWFKICPFCANKIKTNAIKCQYCHEFLNNDEFKQNNHNETRTMTAKDTYRREKTDILNLRNVSLTLTIRWHYFDYNKDQIFYKEHIKSRFWYYWRKIGIVLLFLCWGMILWIIPLILLFGPKRIKCLCVSEEWIWCNCYGHWVFHRRFIFINYSDIESVNIFWNTVKISGKNEFSFNDILEIEKLNKTLKKYKYKITNINKK